MIDNSAAIDKGFARAAKLISDHINGILQEAAKAMVDEAMAKRVQAGHNMTGNTATSYAAGIFENGSLNSIQTPFGKFKASRKKLRQGQVFPAGATRWDGDTQERPFMATIDTDGGYAARTVREWISGQQPIKDGFQLTVMSGVEYGHYQEMSMGIDVLTGTFIDAPTIIQSFLKPMK